MLRITLQSGDETVLKLEGKLRGPWVEELERSWEAARTPRQGKPLAVDMGEVSFIDPRGKELLLRMQREGARLVAVPVVIKFILEGPSPRPDSLGEEH